MMKSIATKAMLAAGAATVAMSAVSDPAEAFTVTVEAPGVQTSQVTGTGLVTEDFDRLATGNVAFPFNFNGDSNIGTYSSAGGANIFDATDVGGAGGAGKFLSIGTGPVTLDLNSPQAYFGLWFSAANAGNMIKFFNDLDVELFSFDANDLVQFVNATGNGPQYLGNPNDGQVPDEIDEIFAFVNFFADTPFSKIEFSESSADGFFESDNHTIATSVEGETGTDINNPEPIPTPALLPGLVGMGVAAFRKRKGEAEEAEA